MSEKRKKGSVYPVKLKKQAIDLYYKGFGRTDIAKESNIYNKKLVNEWVRKYEKERFSGLEDRRGLARGGNKGRKGSYRIRVDCHRPQLSETGAMEPPVSVPQKKYAKKPVVKRLFHDRLFAFKGLLRQLLLIITVIGGYIVS
ncbi:helix-turn-helix domain-containing protein [Alteribacillus sp. JSM 102045]|uniref:terminase gpP N-terminus-related DNA-binding protein n=1 Tax=Alteribacillus sp. JSM 102045 TaxID=1562101 RepID=UPI0035C0B0CA